MGQTDHSRMPAVRPHWQRTPSGDGGAHSEEVGVDDLECHLECLGLLKIFFKLFFSPFLRGLLGIIFYFLGVS